MDIKTVLKIGSLMIPMMIAVSAFAQDDRQAMQAAMKECFQELGLQKPQRGERPSAENRQKLQACLSQKGVSLPQRPPSGNRPQRGNWSDDSGGSAAR